MQKKNNRQGCLLAAMQVSSTVLGHRPGSSQGNLGRIFRILHPVGVVQEALTQAGRSAPYVEPVQACAAGVPVQFFLKA